MPATHSTTPDTELVIRRVYDAPRQLVYDAWTKPEHLEHWQGAPKGMTVSVERSEIRTGGQFKLVMRAADGAEHWLQGQYREVSPPERLVFTHVWLDGKGLPGPETVVTLTFVPDGEQTVLTLTQTGFTSTAARDDHRGGWTSTFDRLEEYLTSGIAAQWESR